MKKIYFLILLFLIVPVLTAFAQDNRAIYIHNEKWDENGRFVYAGQPSFLGTNVSKVTIAMWVKWSIDPTSVATLHEAEGRYASLFAIDNVQSSESGGKKFSNSTNQGLVWLGHNPLNTAFQFGILRNGNTIADTVIGTTQSAAYFQNWHYVAGVYDGVSDTKTLKLYVDGILQSTNTISSGSYNMFDYPPSSKSYKDSLRICIGKSCSNYKLFTGYLDELRFYWGEALTQAQIQEQMYKSSSVVSNPAIYYNFNQTSGISITNQGTATQNGTYYSALVDVHGYDAGEKK